MKYDWNWRRLLNVAGFLVEEGPDGVLLRETNNHNIEFLRDLLRECEVPLPLVRWEQVKMRGKDDVERVNGFQGQALFDVNLPTPTIENWMKAIYIHGGQTSGELFMKNDIRLRELDVGVLPLIRQLLAMNVRTDCSCSGHNVDNAKVWLLNPGEASLRVAEYLEKTFGVKVTVARNLVRIGLTEEAQVIRLGMAIAEENYRKQNQHDIHGEVLDWTAIPLPDIQSFVVLNDRIKSLQERKMMMQKTSKANRTTKAQSTITKAPTMPVQTAQRTSQNRILENQQPLGQEVLDMVKLLTQTQSQLLEYTRSMLMDFGMEVILHDDFVFAKGNIPVLVIAHLDTIYGGKLNRNQIHWDSETKQLRSISGSVGIGGDDRCGIYIILSLLQKGLRPSVLFTTDEEIGRLGAKKFTDFYQKGRLIQEKYKYIVEFDRRGNNDAVFYECENQDFIDYILQFGYDFQWGSFSDISTIAPALGVAAVNLSSGFHFAHKAQEEYIDMSDVVQIIQRAADMIGEEDLASYYPYVQGVEKEVM